MELFLCSAEQGSISEAYGAEPIQRIEDSSGDAVLVWALQYRSRLLRGEQIVRGVSHLRFAADGKVCYHRDYWDAAEELYAKLPVLGGLMRFLSRRLAA